MNKDGQQQVGGENYHDEDEELLSSVPPHLECYFRTGQVEDVANAESPDGVGGDGDGGYSQFEARTIVQGRAMLAQEEGKKSSFLLTHSTTTSTSPSPSPTPSPLPNQLSSQSTTADQNNAENKLLHSIGPCPSHIVVEYKPSWSLSSSKQQQQQQATQQHDTTTSSVPFFLGGVQLVSSAKDAVVYWTGLDGKEMYLMTSKGIKFRGTLPRALTDIDPSTKNREWFKSICVIPGGPRPILRLRISLKNVRPKDSKFADVLSMKLTARLNEQPPTSPTLSQSQVQTQNYSQPRPSTQGGHLVSTHSTKTSKTPSASASHPSTGAVAAVASVSNSTSKAIPVPVAPVPHSQERIRPQAQQQQQQQQSRGEPPVTQSDLNAAMAAISFMSRNMEKAVCERLEKHTMSCVRGVEEEVSALKSIIMAQQQQLIETQKILRQQQILLDRQSNQIRDMRLHQEDIRLCVQAVQADMIIVKCNSQQQQNQQQLSSQPSPRQQPITTTAAEEEPASETDKKHNSEPWENKNQSAAIYIGGADAFGARESKPDKHQQQQHHHQQQALDDEKNSNASEVIVRNDERKIGNNMSMENGNAGDDSIDRKVVLEDDDNDDELGQILDGSGDYSNQEDTQLSLGYNSGEMLNKKDADHEKNGIFVDKKGNQDDSVGEEEDDGDDDDDEYDGDGNDTAFMSIMTESVFLNALDKKPDPPLPSDPIVRFPPERSATLYHGNNYKTLVSNELHHKNEVFLPIGARPGYDIQNGDEMAPSESALQRFSGSGVKEAEHSEDCDDGDEEEIHPNIEVTLWEDDLASGQKMDSNDTVDSEAISEGESGGSDEGKEIAPYETSGDSRGDAVEAMPRSLASAPGTDIFPQEKKEEFDLPELERLIATTRASTEGVEESGILAPESEGTGQSLKTNVKAVDCSLASQFSCAPTSSDEFS